ncbi:transporter associated domain-containing protein [Natronococcus occultus]|uniref:transporter associated domain-containing protein n=1 Tax=Natronococcus occultus TaxID=29288 RepID=UPI00067761BA|nr:transporter associated domain-containing protein [Natronococcus occultus]
MITGEILGPREPAPIRIVDERTAIVRGDVSVALVNEALDLSLPVAATFDTVAGLVPDRARYLPEDVDRVARDDVTTTVEDVADRRIVNVRLTRPAASGR